MLQGRRLAFDDATSIAAHDARPAPATSVSVDPNRRRRLVSWGAVAALVGVLAVSAGLGLISRPTVSGSRGVQASAGLSHQGLSHTGLASLTAAARGSLSSVVGGKQRSYWGRRLKSGAVAFVTARHGIQAQLTAGGGLSIADASGVRVQFGAVGIGRGDSVQAVGGLHRVALTNNRAAVSGAGVRESVTNGPFGIEQAFRVTSRPAGRGSLVISQPVSGAAAQLSAGGAAVRFGAGALTESGLSVTDARGRHLAARLSVSRGRLEIIVKDARAVYPLRIDPMFSQAAELTASNGEANDDFGISVAVSGSTVVIGADHRTVNGNAGQGAAYVYTVSGSSVNQIAYLTAADGQQSDNFGTSVAVSGSTIVVGSPGHNVTVGNMTANAQGEAYVYSVSGTTVSGPTEITASDGAALDVFGSSVGISGSTILVGAPGHSPTDNTQNVQGTAYLFTVSGSSVTQTREISDPGNANGDAFGYVVAISGSTAVVSAPGTSGYEGVVYVYSTSGGGGTPVADPGGAAGDYFGLAIGVSGTTMVASADSVSYVYSVSGTTVSRLAALGEVGPAAVSGSTVVVGSEVYTVSGSTVTASQQLTAPVGSVAFGQDQVAIDGTNIVFGDNAQNSGQGVGYVFSSAVEQPLTVSVSLRPASPTAATDAPVTVGSTEVEDVSVSLASTAGGTYTDITPTDSFSPSGSLQLLTGPTDVSGPARSGSGTYSLQPGQTVTYELTYKVLKLGSTTVQASVTGLDHDGNSVGPVVGARTFGAECSNGQSLEIDSATSTVAAPNGLPVGQPATIKGCDFAAGTTIQFGNPDATVDLAGSQINAAEDAATVMVPYQATTGPITASYSGVTATTPDSVAIDSFRNTDGFKFANYPDKTAEDQIAAAFGAAAVTTGPLLINLRPSFWNLYLREGPGSEKGRCWGFAVLSSRIADGSLSVASFGTAKVAWGLDKTTQLVKAIDAAWWTQFADQVSRYEQAQPSNTAASIESDLKAAFAGNGFEHPALVTFRRYDKDQRAWEGHTVTAFAVTDSTTTPGAYTIHIANSNVPFVTEEDTSAGAHSDALELSDVNVSATGHWTLPREEWAGNIHRVYVVPISALEGHLTLLQTSQLHNAPSASTAVAGLTDLTSNSPVNLDGSASSEADVEPQDDESPAASAAAAATNGSAVGGIGQIILPDHSFSEVLSSKGAVSDFWGDKQNSGSIDASGGIDETSFDPATDTETVAPDPGHAASRTATLSVTSDTTSTDHVVDVTGPVAKKGVSVGLDPKTGAAIVTAGSGASLSITLSSTGKKLTPGSFSTGKIKLGAGQTLTLLPSSWTRIATAALRVTLSHKGTVARRLRLRNGLVAPGARVRKVSTATLRGVHKVHVVIALPSLLAGQSEVQLTSTWHPSKGRAAHSVTTISGGKARRVTVTLAVPKGFTEGQLTLALITINGGTVPSVTRSSSKRKVTVR